MPSEALPGRELGLRWKVPFDLVLIVGVEAKTAAACGHIPVDIYQLVNNVNGVLSPVG